LITTHWVTILIALCSIAHKSSWVLLFTLGIAGPDIHFRWTIYFEGTGDIILLDLLGLSAGAMFIGTSGDD
jgi:hypothetical protein